MFTFSQEKDMMDRIRQCCISTSHRWPVTTSRITCEERDTI